MRGVVIALLRRIDAVSVENVAHVGTPDVWTAHGAIELKHLDAWPRRETTPLRVPHFTAAQRVWLVRRTRAGGRAHVLLRVCGEWILLRGLDAAYKLGNATRRELCDLAVARWDGTPVDDQLIEALGR